jgi:hypothetical protein
MIIAPRAVAPLLLASFAAALSACSAAHPPPAGDGTVDEATAAESDAVDESSRSNGPCAPGEARMCQMHYKDEDGQSHCPWSYQFCQLDGDSWARCGTHLDADAGAVAP